MSQAVAAAAPQPTAKSGVRIATVAWLLTSVYYFYQYSMRSAPAVMMPQLTEAFGLSALGVASIVGLFYYGYSPFSLVAGAAMDRFGPRRLVPFAAIAVGIGAFLFATGQSQIASVGRFIQGAGGVFALVGAQMGWVLRPFIGAPNAPVTFFREREGNFFQAVAEKIADLASGRNPQYWKGSRKGR